VGRSWELIGRGRVARAAVSFAHASARADGVEPGTILRLPLARHETASCAWVAAAWKGASCADWRASRRSAEGVSQTSGWKHLLARICRDDECELERRGMEKMAGAPKLTGADRRWLLSDIELDATLQFGSRRMSLREVLE